MSLQEKIMLALADRIDRDSASSLFEHKWKIRTTPGGRPVVSLRASVRRISDSGCGGWPTPRVFDIHNESYTTAMARQEKGKAAMAAGGPRWSGCMGLPAYAEMATGWATPAQRDWKGATLERWGTNARPLNEQVRETASWPTPKVTAQRSSPNSLNPKTKAGTPSSCALGPEQVAELAMGFVPREVAFCEPSVAVRLGVISNGSPAETAKPGQLNPAFSLFLMGYPSNWIDFAPWKTARGQGL